MPLYSIVRLYLDDANLNLHGSSNSMPCICDKNVLIVARQIAGAHRSE